MNNTISLCMIVKNEEKTIGKCLNSIKYKVNEIIIVDTGSTDATIEIAQKYTSNIYSFEWIDDFSATRNQSLSYATSDYILVLDADEYLDQDVDLNATVASQRDYYTVKIKNFLSYGWVHTHTAIRLFTNKPELKYKNRLHEHLNIEEGQNYLQGEAKFVIQHTGYTNESVEEKTS